MVRTITRRDLFKHSLAVSFGSMVTGIAGTAAAADKVCADPKQMDSSQLSLRQSLNYTEMSSDSTKPCAACAFFQTPADGCGHCMILSGPVNAKGHCDSWGSA